MNKIKCIVLLLGIILPAAFGLANSELTTTKDGGNPIVINKISNKGSDRNNSISASIDGHNLTVNFLTDIGHVWIKVTDATGITLEIDYSETPAGYLYYIPSVGHYVVVITLSDGDEYYGEFEVTD